MGIGRLPACLVDGDETRDLVMSRFQYYNDAVDWPHWPLVHGPFPVAHCLSLSHLIELIISPHVLSTIDYYAACASHASPASPAPPASPAFQVAPNLSALRRFHRHLGIMEMVLVRHVVVRCVIIIIPVVVSA
jgi:hypothetical protein